MDKTFLSQSTSRTLVIFVSLIFVFLDLYNSKKYQGLNNYLTANRNIGTFSLTISLIASALGAWIYLVLLRLQLGEGWVQLLDIL